MVRFRGLVVISAFAAAVIGIAAPANAEPPPVPFKNCTAAKAAGYCDIPSNSPYYGAWLDRDQDGLACEC